MHITDPIRLLIRNAENIPSSKTISVFFKVEFLPSCEKRLFDRDQKKMDAVPRYITVKVKAKKPVYYHTIIDGLSFTFKVHLTSLGLLPMPLWGSGRMSFCLVKLMEIHHQKQDGAELERDTHLMVRKALLFGTKAKMNDSKRLSTSSLISPFCYH